MCQHCKNTPEAIARRTELDAAANTFQQHHTPENRERLYIANRAVWSIHHDYVFDQERQRNAEMQARGIKPVYITHSDPQTVQPERQQVTQSQNMNRIVSVAPWGDTYSAQDAEDGCIPSEASFVEGVEG